MRYRKLGNTGLIVSEMCLGAMTFGSGEGMWATVAGVTQDNVTELIKTAFDRGINFIDSADFYSNGGSEVITGNALRMLGVPRDSYVLATKVLLRMGPGHNQIGLSRYHIMESINASLKRLQVDHIDLYQIHGRDPFTPLEETLDALHDCVRAGKVRYIGLCNLSAWEIAKSLWISDKKNLARFESLQIITRSSGATSNARSSDWRKIRTLPSCRGVRLRAVCFRASSHARTRHPTARVARPWTSRRWTANACGARSM